ncbi:unnamed protein product [Diamesa serratosioi]
MSFVDAISVKIINSSLLLYGRGNELISYNRRENIKHQNINKIKPYDKIHSISFKKLNDNTYRILCSAGRELLITDLVNNQFENSYLVQFNDWISSVKYFEDSTFCILTAHNFAVHLQFGEQQKLKTHEKLRCEENATLYCSKIYGESWENSIFFTGTALGELLVWRKVQNKPKILFRKFVHNGVIFSIDFNGTYLITSSDDRSVKIFQVLQNSADVFQLKEQKQSFGHTSRVFVCKIINYKGTKFISGGEDSNICVWDEAGNFLAKKNVHCSGIIWDVDYDEPTKMLITSSSTGKLNQFNLCEIFHEKLHSEAITDNKGQQVNIAKIKYLNDGALVCLDNNSQIFYRAPTTNCWNKIEQTDNPIKQFMVIEARANQLFLADKNSISVYDSVANQLIFSGQMVIDEHLAESLKDFSYLRSIHPMKENEVLISDSRGNCLVLDIEQKRLLKIFKIPKCTEPWTTSVSKIGQFWLLADRCGNLHQFSIEGDLKNYSNPIHTIKKLHGTLGITNINVENNVIKTTGHDGSIKTLIFNETTQTIEFYHSEKTSLNWIDKVVEINGKNHFFGFNDNYFVVHQKQIIYEHNCGGRHRNWDIFISQDTRKVSFSYVQKSLLNTIEFFLSDPNLMEDYFSWHTKDCNKAVLIQDKDKCVLVSGSEDNQLKLSYIDNKERFSKFKELANISSHISNIKDIIYWRDRDDVWIFSSGGRAQIIVTRLVNMQLVKEEVNFMLLDPCNVGKSKKSSFDPETRFTTLYYYEKSNFLCVGCSDGFIRIFKFIKNSMCSLELLTQFYYERCILKITMVEDFLLTMATDGFVCFWKMDETTGILELSDQLKHNQSGINCFDIFSSENSYKIATSGDDNEIFVSTFEIDQVKKIIILQTIRTNAVHTAPITDLKFISKDVLISTSVDQVIAKLSILCNAIVIKDRKFTCVSDVKGLLWLDDNNLIVYGAGIQLIPNFSD